MNKFLLLLFFISFYSCQTNVEDKKQKEIVDNVGYSIKTNYLLNLIDVLPEKIELPYSYTIRWISNQNQIKRLSKYTVLIKVK